MPKIGELDLRLKRLNFGKYNGKRIVDVPTPYLRWMVEHLDDVDEYRKQLIRGAEVELEHRDRHPGEHFD